MKDLFFNCTGKYAGLISFGFTVKTGYDRYFNFHLFVRNSHRQWGLDESWYDGPYYSFGLGPLLLIVWN